MEISLSAEKIFSIGTFPVTNTLIMSWTVILFLLGITYIVRRRMRRNAREHTIGAIEALIEALLQMVDKVTGDRTQSKRFFPLVATLFIYVILSNWVEVIPGLGTVGIREMHEGKEVIVPFIRASSADLNMTLALAAVTVIAVQIAGITSLGVIRYSKKFINFKNPVSFFVGVLEMLSEVAKLVSFSVRLFGNIFAGEVLLIVMLFLVPYVVPLPFLLLEFFVGFVQALVFSMLALVFLKMATLESH